MTIGDGLSACVHRALGGRVPSPCLHVPRVLWVPPVGKHTHIHIDHFSQLVMIVFDMCLSCHTTTFISFPFNVYNLINITLFLSLVIITINMTKPKWSNQPTNQKNRWDYSTFDFALMIYRDPTHTHTLTRDTRSRSSSHMKHVFAFIKCERREFALLILLSFDRNRMISIIVVCGVYGWQDKKKLQ